ncbi:Protein CutA -like protein [Halotydeus destructor]|nr:Protein CutA -like protein [Halotydeus destructor]
MAIPIYPDDMTHAPMGAHPHRQMRSAGRRNSLPACKSPIGQVVIYSALFWIALTVVVGLSISMFFLYRFASSYLFVSQAVSRLCGQSSSISLMNSQASEQCAKLLSGTEYSISYVTIDSEEAAETLAEKIIQSKLAACVNILPKVKSVYQWKGKLVKDNESMLMIKSRISKLEQLTAFIRENHSYEVCEVISVPIQHGNQPYLQWIGDMVPNTEPSEGNN